MDNATLQTIGIFAFPPFVIGVIFYVNNSTCTSLNKSIDDLRAQMTNDHNRMWTEMKSGFERLENKLDAHINDKELHY